MNTFFEGIRTRRCGSTFSVREPNEQGDGDCHIARHAAANCMADFYSSPKILTTVEECVIEAGEQHTKGIGLVLSSDKVGDIVELLKKVGLFESPREEEAA